MLIVQKDSQVKLESNSSVFKRRLNVVSDWTARSEDGREFQFGRNLGANNGYTNENTPIMSVTDL